jgi:hypothetical protein
MKRVDIYVGEQKLDLFNDEQIIVNSSAQDIQDISKIHTDYSQSFTIPCSTVNNAVFEHYYNNDVDGVVDNQLRREARIELDFTIFKTGKIQIQKSSIVKGQAESYTVTFYGDLVKLKDTIGEDKLGDLDYSTINHAITTANYRDRITGVTKDAVGYPLISSDRLWTHGDSGANDIETTGGGLYRDELFPSVKVWSIVDLIEAKYGITFSGSFLQSKHFKSLALWYKNKLAPNEISQPYDLYNGGDVTFSNGYIYGDVVFTYVDPSSLSIYDVTNVTHTVQVQVVTVSTDDWFLDVYQNDILTTSLIKSGGGSYTSTIMLNGANSASLDRNFSFKIRSEGVASFTGNLIYKLSFTETDPSVGSANIVNTYTNAFVAFTVALNTDLASYAPDMGVMDFLKGISNMFNLTIIGDGVDAYKWMPLHDFYNSGNEYNITDYVSKDKITVERPQLFKEFDFKYSESKSILNSEFNELFSRQYGDLNATFPYDGTKFTLKLPFETILHRKISGTPLQLGYCVDKDSKPYIPKPVILYENTQVSTVEFYFEGVFHSGSYMPFGQDIAEGLVNSNINFNLEVSSYTELPESNTLYELYYSDYLSNLYNRKTRKIKINSNLPSSILNKLNLNDKIIVGDKRYIIDKISTNLSSRDVSLDLLSWWESDYSQGKNYSLSSSGQTINIHFELGEKTISLGTPSFGSFSSSVGTGSFSTQLAVYGNTTGVARSNEIQATITDVNNNATISTITINQA